MVAFIVEFVLLFFFTLDAVSVQERDYSYNFISTNRTGNWTASIVSEINCLVN